MDNFFKILIIPIVKYIALIMIFYFGIAIIYTNLNFKGSSISVFMGI